MAKPITRTPEEVAVYEAWEKILRESLPGYRWAFLTKCKLFPTTFINVGWRVIQFDGEYWLRLNGEPIHHAEIKSWGSPVPNPVPNPEPTKEPAV